MSTPIEPRKWIPRTLAPRTHENASGWWRAGVVEDATHKPGQEPATVSLSCTFPSHTPDIYSPHALAHSYVDAFSRGYAEALNDHARVVAAARQAQAALADLVLDLVDDVRPEWEAAIKAKNDLRMALSGFKF